MSRLTFGENAVASLPHPQLLRRPDGPTPIVSVRGVVKRFPMRRPWREIARAPFARPTATVLHGIDLDVAPGELLGILGPNGAGKSTLFKILSTVLLPDAGTVRVDGIDAVADPVAVRRRLVPASIEDRSLFWRMSARENLLVYAALHDIPRAEARRRSDDLLELVQLADAGTKLVNSFSSGMRQRLMIARALLARPQVLLLDEPTRSLDPISARTFRRFLRDVIVNEQRCTVLLATHSAEEAFDLADRVAVLDRGRLVAAGRSEELVREIGDERYLIATRAPEHSIFSELERRGLSGAARQREEKVDGWTLVELEIVGGADRAAAVLDALTGAGVTVARFERLQLSLADMLERIVARSAREDRHA